MAEKWVPIEPKGKPKGDNYYGYPNRKKLEETLVEVKSHIGERVLLFGGGGSGSQLATLEDAHIEEFPMSIEGKIQERWGLKVDLVLDEPIMGSKDFDPWLDSWKIAVQREEVIIPKAVTSRGERKSRKKSGHRKQKKTMGISSSRR